MSPACKWMVAPLALLLASIPTCGAGGPNAGPEPEQPTPRVRLRISGFMEGRLEPCGCASGQMGGLPRRVFHLKQERDYDLLLEGGNLVAGGTPLDAQKLATALLVLSMPPIEYDAFGLGPRDLEMPLADLTQYLEVFGAAPGRPEGGIPVIASDLVAPAEVPWPVAPFVEHDTGEATVRVASFALATPAEGAGASLQLIPPAAAWERAMAGAAPETYRVLLVHGDPELVRAQADLRPEPDLIVGITETVAEPPAGFEPVGGVPVVYPGTRGRMLLDLTLTRQDGAPRITRYEVVQLRGSETAKGALEDRDTKLALLGHRQDVKNQGIRELMARREPTPTGASYVGSEVCADCHVESWDVWKDTKHARAWTTLEEAESGDRYGWPVTHYPDCVQCHVVGYGFETGFVNPAETPELAGVGCEECHGPGSAHVDSGGEVVMGEIGVGSCLGCHDFEQSPGFAENYAERWKQIEHGSY